MSEKTSSHQYRSEESQLTFRYDQLHGFAYVITDSFDRTPVPSAILRLSVLHVDGKKPISLIVSYLQGFVDVLRLTRPHENRAVVKIVAFAPVFDIVPVKGMIVADDVNRSACTLLHFARSGEHVNTCN